MVAAGDCALEVQCLALRACMLFRVSSPLAHRPQVVWVVWLVRPKTFAGCVLTRRIMRLANRNQQDRHSGSSYATVTLEKAAWDDCATDVGLGDDPTAVGPEGKSSYYEVEI